MFTSAAIPHGEFIVEYKGALHELPFDTAEDTYLYTFKHGGKDFWYV